MNFKDILFGIEIETVQCTRSQIAQAIHKVVGGSICRLNEQSRTDHWQVKDPQGGCWNVVSDASLTDVPEALRAEVVSPVLGYHDIERLQEVVRSVQQIGGKINKQCSVHIHIDAAPFDSNQLCNLLKIVYKQEPLILHALGISKRRLGRYTKPINDQLIDKLVTKKPQTKDQLNQLWYGYQNQRPEQYHPSRYHGVNLHSVWYRGTIEFRWFEATLHAGVIKAYLQFCLAIAAKALNNKAASKNKREFNTKSAKYDFRVFLLSLGFIGDEFKTARKHLMSKMPGDAAFKWGRGITKKMMVAQLGE